MSLSHVIVHDLTGFGVVQIRQLFAFCGSVTNVSLVGNNKQFALVEYATPGVSQHIPEQAVPVVGRGRSHSLALPCND